MLQKMIDISEYSYEDVRLFYPEIDLSDYEMTDYFVEVNTRSTHEDYDFITLLLGQEFTNLQVVFRNKREEDGIFFDTLMYLQQ